MIDLAIRGSTIVDGTGAPSYSADIAIAGDRIVAIGSNVPSNAKREIDASGLVVAPGFIDVHTHDDAALLARPEMAPKLSQGVTTVVAGNCGVSGAPCPPGRELNDLMGLVFKSSTSTAPDFAELLARARTAVPAVNCAFLAGHSTLRLAVMGEDLARPAKPVEMREMRNLLDQCLDQGAIGMSTGLFYAPAEHATAEEIVEVGAPLGAHDGLYVTHLRDEGNHVLESIDEALLIGRRIGAPVIISHHKCMGRANFGRSLQTLARLDAAIHVQAVAWDVYPYTAGSTVLRSDLVASAEKTLIAWSDAMPRFSGHDLHEVITELGGSLEEVVQRLQPAGAIYFMMAEEDVTRILTSTAAMIGSDGLPEDIHPHPRLWGTFPRVLGRYVRERNVLSLENAVWRMSGLSASRFNFRERGEVRVGFFADLCVFDPLLVLDRATFERPTLPATGIRHVLVNGQLAMFDGQLTGVRAGHVLVHPH